MSSPGSASGSYRSISLAVEALTKQGFKKLNNSTYRVLRDHITFDAHIEVRDPYKKVVVHVKKSEGKHDKARTSVQDE